MDIDGVEVIEEAEDFGYAWHWDDPRGFQSEILWDRQGGHMTLGTRTLPGGWIHNRLGNEVARTVYEARGYVEEYVARAAAKPSA